MSALDFVARWRVRLGYFLAIVAFWLGRPMPRSIVFGGSIGLIGLAIRAYAAGYLRKQELLTTAGPYAYTRNPLYFGSSLLAIGVAVGLHSWWAAALVLVYFTLVYSFVMRREEMELRSQHGAAFDDYARSVPLFFPRFAPPKRPAAVEENTPSQSLRSPSAYQPAATNSASFSWRQYVKNREYRAAIGYFFLLIALTVIWRLHTA